MNTVIVKSSRFNAHYPVDIPKNTVNAESVLVRPDSEWDGLTVRIHWLNVASGVEKVVLLERDQPNTIPWEVLADLGELRMGLVGLDGETVIKPTIWLTYGYVADGVDPESGSDPQPPTPSWEQQMVALAEAAANAAKAAKETSDNLQAAAEAGEFDGDPGPAGPPGKSPIIQDGNWWLWDVEAQEYRDTGIAASGGGGGGVSSYNDLSDRPTIGGVLLEGNKTAEQLGLAKASQIPNVPSWAMQPKKPTYTAQEVGAQPQGDYALRSEIPTTLPNPNPLIIKGQTYDGSQAVKVEVSDGKTPVKGVDYFTEADVQEVAEKAAALVPVGTVKPRLIADITIGDGGSNSTKQDIENIDDIYSICLTIYPPDGESITFNNVYISILTNSSSVQIGHLNAFSTTNGRKVIIRADRFLDSISCLAYNCEAYMWNTKTLFAAFYNGTWDGATAIYVSGGALPEGTRIKVVGK